MIESLYHKTPLQHSHEMSDESTQIYLKWEAYQPSGSFKNRGIGRICEEYAKNAQCFVSSSGGNAGLAVAYSGRLLNVKVKVIVPKTSPLMMREKIQNEGAEVIVRGDDWNGADAYARELSKQDGFYYISPFDDSLIWEGHSTIIDEISKAKFKPDAIVTAVGGGGLFCGIMEGLKRAGWGDVPVYTAETEGAASLAKSIEAGKLVTLDSINTIALSLGAKRVAKQAFDWTKKHLVYPVVVTDKEALDAVKKFANHHRHLVEPACGAALAVAYGKKINKEHKNVVVIVCGGSAVNDELIKQWEEKVK